METPFRTPSDVPAHLFGIERRADQREPTRIVVDGTLLVEDRIHVGVGHDICSRCPRWDIECGAPRARLSRTGQISRMVQSTQHGKASTSAELLNNSRRFLVPYGDPFEYKSFKNPVCCSCSFS